MEQEFISDPSFQKAGFEHSLLGNSGSPYQLLLLERKASLAKAPTLYLSAGIHGDEPAGILAIQKMLQEDRFTHHIHWLIFPCLNPTGYLNKTRQNDRGIDLNRDYFSQKSEEVRTHSAWIQENSCDIDLYLSLHEDWEARGCYLYEINTSSDGQGFAKEILKTAEPLIPLEQGPVVDGHQLNAPGLILHRPIPDEFERWPEAIYTCKQKPLLSYTFETPSTLELERRIQAHIAVIEFCATMLIP